MFHRFNRLPFRGQGAACAARGWGSTMGPLGPCRPAGAEEGP